MSLSKSMIQVDEMSRKWTEERLADFIWENRPLEKLKAEILAKRLVEAGAIRMDDPGPWAILYYCGYSLTLLCHDDFLSLEEALRALEEHGEIGVEYHIVSLHRKAELRLVGHIADGAEANNKHASDCAVHNALAMKPTPCDCQHD